MKRTLAVCALVLAASIWAVWFFGHTDRSPTAAAIAALIAGCTLAAAMAIARAMAINR